MSTFLRAIVQHTISIPSPLESQLVVLPTRRAAAVLKDIYAGVLPSASWLPQFATLDEWASIVSGVEPIHPIDLKFACYRAYQKCMGPMGHDISAFFSWSDALLSDFNDIEAYGVDPVSIFRDLKAYSEIEHFSFLSEPLTPWQEQYRLFWSALPEIHKRLNEDLTERRKAYPGLMIRMAAKQLNAWLRAAPYEHITVAGFNALSENEFDLLMQLQEAGRGTILFEGHNWYIQDDQNLAGHFIRKNLGRGLGTLFTPEGEDVREENGPAATMRIISASSKVDAADAVASLLAEANLDLESSTGVVLADEGLLVPVLNRIPPDIEHVNITMGLSPADGIFATWIEMVIELHQKALTTSGYAFEWALLLRFVAHPFSQIMGAELHASVDAMLYVPAEKATNWAVPAWMHPILKPWQDNLSEAIDALAETFWLLSEKMDDREPELMLASEGMAQLTILFAKLKVYPESGELGLPALSALTRRSLRSGRLTLTGEPFEGLQMMGILETRTLSFDRLILVSVNEGTLPGNSRHESFLPFEIRAFHKLPRKREKEAVYAYHFYRLLHTCHRAELIYIADPDDSSAGGKSRYLFQLEYQQRKLGLRQIESAHTGSTMQFESAGSTIEKSSEVTVQILNYLNTRLSASGINTFLNDPLDWYYRNVLRLPEPADDTELQPSTFGTIVHGVLEELYKPFIGQEVDMPALKSMLNQYLGLLQSQFQEHAPRFDWKQGMNRVHYERARLMIEAYLRSEMHLVHAGEKVELVGCEIRFNHPMQVHLENGEELTIALTGVADKLERRNGTLRVVDYKTGMVKANDLKIKDWPDIDAGAFIGNEKAFQLMLYNWLGIKEWNDLDMEAQIISLPAPGKRDLILPQKLTSDEDIQAFEAAIASIVRQMLDPDVPIARNETYKYPVFEA